MKWYKVKKQSFQIVKNFSRKQSFATTLQYQQVDIPQIYWFHLFVFTKYIMRYQYAIFSKYYTDLQMCFVLYLWNYDAVKNEQRVQSSFEILHLAKFYLFIHLLYFYVVNFPIFYDMSLQNSRATFSRIIVSWVQSSSPKAKVSLEQTTYKLAKAI